MSTSEDRAKEAKKRKQIVGRIRALLKKTIENGCTKEEAEAAQETARKMMEKYRVTEDELKGELKRQPPPRTSTMDDFYAFLPTHEYWYVPARALWPAATIRSILGKDATLVLDNDRPTKEVTWAPGMPTIIENRIAFGGGWIDEKGAHTFNLYRPPLPIGGDRDKAGKWRALGEKLWGDHQDHIERWLASRVQRPEVKINHALVFGSEKHGIGKDSYLIPARRAVGPWNFRDVSALRAFEKAHAENSFLEAVILRINEAHDLGDKRFSFYERTKDWHAAPPETLMIRDLWIKQHPMINLVNAVITTNHRTDGVYWPPEDRRHYAAWSACLPQDFTVEYWNDLHNWLAAEGAEHAARYLATLDIRDFNPKAPPPKTEWWHTVVNANLVPEASGLRDLLDHMAVPDVLDDTIMLLPDAVTPTMLVRSAQRSGDRQLAAWLADAKNRRTIPHRLEQVGYTIYRNPASEDGYWKVGGKRQPVYVRKDQELWQRDRALRELQAAEGGRPADDDGGAEDFGPA